MLTANHSSPTTATHDQPDEQRLADLRQLDECIAKTRLLLRGMRDERDRMLSRLSIATRGAYQAQCIITAVGGRQSAVGSEAAFVHCGEPPASSLLTDAHLAAQAELHRHTADRLDDFRVQRRINSLRRISPREQRDLEAMQTAHEARAALDRRIEEDESEPGLDYME